MMIDRVINNPDRFFTRIGRCGPRKLMRDHMLFSGLFIALLLFNPLNAFASDISVSDEGELTDSAVEEALSRALNSKNPNSRNQYCKIVVLNEGQLGYVYGANSLSTMGAAGRAARLEVVASHNSFRLKIDSPFGFSVAPHHGNDNVIFTTSFSGDGATSFTSTPGTHDQKLRAGRTQITADLVAYRGADSFPAGNYQAQVTLRCE